MLKFWHTGRQLDVAILDFSKAFDTVPHRRLYYPSYTITVSAGMC